mgnify:CR=1 FL=1
MDKKEERRKKINEKISKLNDFFAKHGKQISPTIPRIRKDAELINLMNVAEKTREALKESGRELSTLSFNKPEEIEETLKMLGFVIENKKWKDPYLEVNLLLEWAIYRAFCALGGRVPHGFGPILNWDGGEPIHTSSGLRPDLLVDFDDFSVIVECTISSGPRQYDTEAEPVIRHVARVIHEKKHESHPVYAFFVARELDPNVIEYFFVYHAFHKHPLAKEFITVIPLNVSQFKVIFEKLVEGMTAKQTIADIFKQTQNIKSLKTCEACGIPKVNADSWHKQVVNLVEEKLGVQIR